MSEVVNPQTEIGIFTGTLDVIVAKMKTPDTGAAAPTYDTPRVLGRGIEVSISPQYAEGELNASNVVVRRAKKIQKYNLKVNVDAISPEGLNYVLGRKKDANGVEILGGDDTAAPYVAVGLCRTKDNGAKELWWLYKGQFAEPEVSGKTEVSGSIEYQTRTLDAVCDRRIYDRRLGMVVDSDDSTVPAKVISDWFKAVYEATDTPQATE